MGKKIPHKYRNKRHPAHKLAAKSQRTQRDKEKSIVNKKIIASIEGSKEVHLNNNEALESTCDLPVISAVHGNDYFEKHPFHSGLESRVQPVEENEISFETADSTVIKTETCEEENNMHDKIDEPVLKTISETLPRHQLKDLNSVLESRVQIIEENEVSFETVDSTVIKTESCEEEIDLHDKTDESVLKKDLNIPNKENKLLIDIIKYFDECAKADKFDLAGKLYAAKLRSVPYTNQQAMAESLCRQVIVEAELFNLDEKIVLEKQQRPDYLSNCKTPTYVTNKSDFEQSKFLQLEKDALFQNIEERLSENIKEDRFDKFGKFYATKMRSFSCFQYYYADKLMNEIVLEAEVGRLRAHYRLSKTGNPPPQTFATGKSYSKECRAKVTVLPASDITCANNKTWLKQPQKQLITYSRFKPSSAPVTPTPDLTSIKNNVHQYSTSLSPSVSNTALNTHGPKKSVNKQLITACVDQGFKNSSLKVTLGSLMPTPNATSGQNNVHKFPESMPSLSASNKFLKMSNQNETRQPAIEQLINNSDRDLKNPPPVVIPTVISIPNNVNQKSTNNLIKVLFVKQGHQPPSLSPDKDGQFLSSEERKQTDAVSKIDS